MRMLKHLYCQEGKKFMEMKHIMIMNMMMGKTYKLSANKSHDSIDSVSDDSEKIDCVEEERRGTKIKKRKTGCLPQNSGILPKKAVKEGCKQTYDKVNYSKFCEKEIKSKISHNLLNVHKQKKGICNCYLSKAGKEH